MAHVAQQQPLGGYMHVTVCHSVCTCMKGRPATQ